MIGLLLALHPRSWRARYGEEFRSLLEAGPLTMAVVLDVLRNAARQHGRAHALALHFSMALAVSVVVEVVAVGAHLTDNILWPPSTALRAVALAVLVLAWLPVVATLNRSMRHRRPHAQAEG